MKKNRNTRIRTIYDSPLNGIDYIDIIIQPDVFVLNMIPRNLNTFSFDEYIQIQIENFESIYDGFKLTSRYTSEAIFGTDSYTIEFTFLPRNYNERSTMVVMWEKKGDTVWELNYSCPIKEFKTGLEDFLKIINSIRFYDINQESSLTDNNESMLNTHVDKLHKIIFRFPKNWDVNSGEFITLTNYDPAVDYKPLVLLHCFKPISLIETNNIIIKGGERIKNIKPVWVYPADQKHDLKRLLTQSEFVAVKKIESPENVLVIRFSHEGDFSNYILKLVKSDLDEHLTIDSFDPILSEITFTFKMECVTDFDCLTDLSANNNIKSPKSYRGIQKDYPSIDYLTRDFSALRKQILDRLSVLLQGWTEQNIPDMTITLVELLCYIGDHLSYYQDAIATESYLETARHRISLKRHARLLNYYVNNGCNARAWMYIEASSQSGNFKIPKGTKFLTSSNKTSSSVIPIQHNLDTIIKSNPDTEIFESMHDVIVNSNHNEILFYNWNNFYEYLPVGTTSASFRNDKFLFLWNNINNDNKSNEDFNNLKDFLVHTLDLKWIDSPLSNINIQNKDNKITITESSTNNSLSVTINKDDNDTFASLEATDDTSTTTHGRRNSTKIPLKLYEFIVKKEMGDLRIFEKDNKFDKFLFLWNNINNDNKSNEDFNNLKDFLVHTLDLKWIDSPLSNINIQNKDNKITITESSTNNSLSVTINKDDNDTFASLEATDNTSTTTHGNRNATKIPRKLYEFIVKNINDQKSIYYISLKSGSIIVFEETRSPLTGKLKDANKYNRHAVRLNSVVPKIDKLTKTPIIDVSWDQLDALPFPIFISETKDENNKFRVAYVGRGNIVLADHGYTIEKSIRQSATDADIITENEHLPRKVSEFIGFVPFDKNEKFRPIISNKPLTFSRIFDSSLSASELYITNMQELKPSIKLFGDNKWWYPIAQEELLDDNSTDQFEVELDDEGTAFIRFSNNVNFITNYYNTFMNNSIVGSNNNDYYKIPFFASYRLGNGIKGNVGMETIIKIVSDHKYDIKSVRNPLPAKGGVEPQNTESIRKYAPASFKTQDRAVTLEDYSKVLETHSEIQKSIAFLRWTGSWNTVFIFVDRFGNKPVDALFETSIRDFLEKYRLVGYDIEISGPVYVPLEIKIKVLVDPNYGAQEIKKRLINVFCNSNLSAARNKCFFHPDNFTFGQSLFVSSLYGAIATIEGVSSISIEKFQRWGRPSNMELENGTIEVNSYEIICVDNDYNFPERGVIDFEVLEDCREGVVG